MKNLNKESYIKLLNKTDICVGTFVEENGGCWSMSIAEAILAGNAVIIPNHSGYSEIVYNQNFDGLCFDEGIIKVYLLTLIDYKEFRDENAKNAKKIYLKENSSQKVIRRFEQILFKNKK